MAFGKSIAGVGRLSVLEEVSQWLRQLYMELTTDPGLVAAIYFDGTAASPVATARSGIAAVIAKLGTGHYQLTFEEPRIGLLYGVQVSTVSAAPLVGYCTAKTTTTADIKITTLAGVLTDSADIFVAVVALPR